MISQTGGMCKNADSNLMVSQQPQGVSLPVDSPWALVGLDVHLVVIDIHLWDFHLKVVGQQLDGLAHSTHAWPAGGMEHLLQGWGEDPHGHWIDRAGRGRGVKGERDINTDALQWNGDSVRLPVTNNPLRAGQRCKQSKYTTNKGCI